MIETPSAPSLPTDQASRTMTPEVSSGTSLSGGVLLTSTTTDEPTATAPGWISRNLRNGVVMCLTATVVYLAIVERNASAIAGLIAAWTWSAGGMFQERAALKQPGKDS